MRKFYPLIVALFLLGTNAIAQIKVYESPSVILTKEIIEERIREARAQGTQEWELVNYRKGLTKLMISQQQNLAAGNSVQRGAPPVVQAACTNVDFEQGNYNGWTLTSGNINGVTLPCNTCASSSGGIAAVTTSSNSGTTWSAGVDICTNQPAVAPGGGVYSLCLNNNTAGGKMQEIQQTFAITAANNVFTYQYLAVLQDGQHAPSDQPYFMSQMLDGSGNVIPCTYVLQSAAASISGWTPAPSCPGTNYKGWVTVTLDMTSYIGQNVTIEFLVSDCNQGGHYGYCYIDGSCNQIQTNNTVTICPGSTQLCGPPGFNTYSWSGPVTGNTQCLNTSTAGSYTLVTTGQCPAPTRYYTVTISPTPTVNFTSTVTPCSNTVPFTNNTTINGGASVTGYSWDFGDGNTSTAQNPSNTYPGPGTYNVVLTATSNVGCVGTYSATVTIGPGPTAVFSANPVCPGGTTSFTNTSTGGTAYSWDFGDGNTSTAQNPTNTYAAPGTYVVTLTVTGTGTCVATNTMNVTVNPLPTVTATSATTCPGGSATITAGGASTYVWSTGATTASITDNPASTTSYTVTGTTAAGCTNTAVGTITIAGSPTVTTNPTTICAGTTGTITASGATTYTWTGPSIVGSPNSATLTANPTTTSTYTVLGAIGSCTATATEVITVNPMPTPSFVSSVECFGTPTSFTNNSTPAGSNYNWDLGDGNSSTVQNPTENYPAAGSYVVTLTVTTTPGNCQATVTGTVTVKPIPSLNPVSDVTVCDQQQIIVQPFTSVPAGATVGWTNSNTTIGLAANGTGNINPFTGTSGGSNTPVTGVVTAIPTLNGCVGQPINFNLTVSPQPTVTLTSPPFICPGQVVPAPTYTLNPNDPNTVFSWTNNNTNTGMGASGTGDPSTYTFTAGSNATMANITGIVTVTPTLGTCVGPPATYTVTIYPTPVINPVANIEKCPNLPIGPINLSVMPGGGTPSFAWSNSNPNIGLSSSGTVTPIPQFTGVNTGSTQQVANISVGASLNGCPAIPVPFTITIDPNPVAQFSATNKICLGTAMDFHDLSTVGSGYINSWAWNMDAGPAFSSAQNPQYTILTPGTHSITLVSTTDKGCTNVITHTIYINPIPTATFTGGGQGCPILTVNNFVDGSSVPDGTPIMSWNWNFGNGATCNTQQVPGVLTYGNPSPVQNAVYTVSLTVISDSGCVSQTYSNPCVTVWPHPLPGFSWGPSDPAPDIDNPTVYFFDQSQGANGPNGLLWNLGDIYLNNPQSNFTTAQNPVHVYEYYEPATYTVTQWVSNIYGCKDSLTKTIEIIPNWTFYIPNAFSPNGDGVNEGFKGTGVGIDGSTYNLWVFDRWGNMIFYTNDMEKAWDGKIMGKSGDVVQEDVYVWKVKFHDFLGRRHEFKGTVSVIK